MKTLKLSISSKKEVIKSLNDLEKEYNRLYQNFEEELVPAVDHIKRISFDIDEELVKGAYRSAYEEMKEQWELTNEMAQLGIAVEIIDHEFNILYSAMNNSILELSPKIEKHSELSKTFKYFKNAFHQLEDKYELLSPLYRAAGIVAKDVFGTEMINYLKKFFQNTFNKEGISILTTEEFLNCSILIKEPVIYAVLINIINNAIYWMRSVENRKIKFDFNTTKNEILILNSGEPIKDFQLKKIFDLFYSKRGGRGLGLYLAKQSLQKSYMDIYATNDPKYNQLNGACFIISLDMAD
jgi:signal transduction histidine kinase